MILVHVCCRPYYKVIKKKKFGIPSIEILKVTKSAYIQNMETIWQNTELRKERSIFIQNTGVI